MNEQRIQVGKTIDLPLKGVRQFQPTIKEYIIDEWRAMGYTGVNVIREGIRVIIEPVGKKEAL